MLAYAFYERDARVRRYAETLAARGDTVHVFSIRAAGQPAEQVLKGVWVRRLQPRTYDESGPLSHLLKLVRFLAASATQVARAEMRTAYDLIHVHSVPDFEVLAALWPKLRGARVILDIHDIVPELYASKFGVSSRSLAFRGLLLVERLCTAIADHVLVANDIWRERLVSRAVPAHKCTTMLNYPNPEIFRPRPRTRHDGRFVVLFPGTLNWHQGVDVAIRAVDLVKHQAPNMELHVYGEGPEKTNLRRLAATLGLGGRVAFHGFLPLERIAEVMADADLGIVPKRARGFGNEAFSTKIMEFMATGIPTVVARTEIDQRYFDESVVRFFESESPADLARALLELWADRAAGDRLVTNARAAMAANGWQSAGAAYLRLVDDLVGTDAATGQA
jgi:glycosyltransferase involved in cell wall biosynthesis